MQYDTKKKKNRKSALWLTETFIALGNVKDRIFVANDQKLLTPLVQDFCTVYRTRSIPFLTLFDDISNVSVVSLSSRFRDERELGKNSKNLCHS
jgi:hypothetical protein